ncbi:hypothetical protein Dda_8637 [Drechslerella dactyloides]|uniref:BTB domain-containing protein n=1 Tax=Drechslerella dactyloides TaxID=74499 RepID=A0AAD6ISF9_DREDA|nr:hypothetical protein Dda_8637 [Drechslerella dactyloides]
MTARAGNETAGGSFSRYAPEHQFSPILKPSLKSSTSILLASDSYRAYRLLGNAKYSDLKLIVGPDNNEFLVHRNIVCSASSYIDRWVTQQTEALRKATSAANQAAAMKPFQFGAPPEPVTTVPAQGILAIRLPNIQKKIMEHILHYMYGQGDELFQKLGMEKIEVYQCAHYLQMADLKNCILREYTRLFQEKEGIWNPQHIISVIGVVIELEYDGLNTGDYRFQKCSPAVRQMLNALLNFVELESIIYGEEFQYLLSDTRISRTLVMALLSRTWECHTCHTSKTPQQTIVSCSKCGEILAQFERLTRALGN